MPKKKKEVKSKKFELSYFSKILLAVGLIVISLAVIRVLSGSEDTWVCESGVWVMHGVPNKPKPVSACGGEDIFNWDRGVQLVNDCKVKKMSQTQDRNVQFVLGDGTIKKTMEPKFDNVVNLAKSVSKRCGQIKVTTEKSR